MFTLNYDLIVERALSAVGLPVRRFPDRYDQVGMTGGVMDSAAEEEEILIVKPHGSIDWVSKQQFDVQQARYHEFGQSDLAETARGRDLVFGDTPVSSAAPLLEGLQNHDDPLRHIHQILDLDSYLPPTTTTTLPPVFAEGDGRGDDVVEVVIPSAAAVVTFTHDGSSNFIVRPFDSDFDTGQTLVNVIGRYEGTRPLQLFEGEEVAGFEIQANGNWTFLIENITSARNESCSPTAVEGDGDDVVVINDFLGAGGPADITHGGDSNFIVHAYGGGDTSSLVNEIGSYEGTVLVTTDSFLWEFEADGVWSIGC